MDMVRISADAVQDIKSILKESKIENTYLRINASIG
jgi:Fe-S cluster assembly iron-binding protein IscA